MSIKTEPDTEMQIDIVEGMDDATVEEPIQIPLISREEAEVESIRIANSIMNGDVTIRSEGILDMIIDDLSGFAHHNRNKLKNFPEQLAAVLTTTIKNLLLNEASYSYFEDLYEEYIEK